MVDGKQYGVGDPIALSEVERLPVQSPLRPVPFESE